DRVGCGLWTREWAFTCGFPAGGWVVHPCADGPVSMSRFARGGRPPALILPVLGITDFRCVSRVSRAAPVKRDKRRLRAAARPPPAFPARPGRPAAPRVTPRATAGPAPLHPGRRAAQAARPAPRCPAPAPVRRERTHRVA